MYIVSKTSTHRSEISIRTCFFTNNSYVENAEPAGNSTEDLNTQRTYLIEMIEGYPQKDYQKYLKNYTGLLEWQFTNISEANNTPSIRGSHGAI